MKLRKVLVYKDKVLCNKNLDSNRYDMLLARQDYIINEHQVRFSKYINELMRSSFEKEGLFGPGY